MAAPPSAPNRGGSELVAVKVRPRSSRSCVEQGADGGLVVCVHAPAADDKANRECVAVIAEALGVAKSAVQLARGHKSRAKQIAVAGLSAAEVRSRLARAAEAQKP